VNSVISKTKLVTGGNTGSDANKTSNKSVVKYTDAEAVLFSLCVHVWYMGSELYGLY